MENRTGTDYRKHIGSVDRDRYHDHGHDRNAVAVAVPSCSSCIAGRSFHGLNSFHSSSSTCVVRS